MNGRPPNAQPAPDSAPEQLRLAEAAAQWRARLDEGLEAADEEKFAAWLEADPRHAEIFREMDATWSVLDRAAELPVAALGGPVPAAPAAAASRRSWLPVTLAAAAALALATGVLWQRDRLAGRDYRERAAAAAGMVHRLNLPDGSVVRLNSDSAVSARFSPRERRIVLERGEASFAVARDAARPFVVSTAGVDVQAVGTVFHVSQRQAAVEVLVTEGKVKVADASRGATLLATRPAPVETAAADTLAAGEKVVIAVPAAAAPVAAVPETVPAPEIARALAWQERRIEFNATPLEEIAREFNRYNQHQLVIADAELARLSFGGSFRVDEPETFIRLIETRSDVTIERKSRQTIIRSPR